MPFFLSDSFVYQQAIYPYLSLKDFLTFNNASNRELNNIHTTFMRSPHFGLIYKNDFDQAALNEDELQMQLLEWVRRKAVHNSICEATQWNLVQSMYLPLERYMRSYPFVKKICVPLDVKPIIIMTMNILLGCFPNVEELGYRLEDKAYTEDTIRSLLILARYLPLRCIDLDTADSDKLPNYCIALLKRLLLILGNKLKELSFPTLVATPSSFLRSLSKRCPNMRRLPSTHMHFNVTAEIYLSACRNMPKLEELSVAICYFALQDDDVIPLLVHLPGLKRVNLPLSSLTGRSLQAMRHLIPQLEIIDLPVIKWTGNGIKSLILRYVSEQDVYSMNIVEFLKALPPIEELTLEARFLPAVAQLLGPHLTHVDCSSVRRLNICKCPDIQVGTVFLPRLSSVEEVSIDEGDVPLGEEAESSVRSFFEILCQNNPTVKSLVLTKLSYLTDEIMMSVISHIPSLIRVEFTIGYENSLTKEVLFAMARTGKTWSNMTLILKNNEFILDIREAIDIHGLKTLELAMYANNFNNYFRYRGIGGKPVSASSLTRAMNDVVDDSVPQLFITGEVEPGGEVDFEMEGQNFAGQFEDAENDFVDIDDDDDDDDDEI